MVTIKRSNVISAVIFLAILQEAGTASAQIEEIFVTARKREETALAVPVVASYVSKEQLENFSVNDIQSLADWVPGLLIGDSTGAFGAVVSLRGVVTSTASAAVDQSVVLNLDGLQLSHGMALRSAMFDVERVEVLKGPQALFFGKNSPGGVIAIRSANPTDEYEVIGRIGYEIEAKEILGEAIISGPITETLGGRLAVSFSSLDGLFKNTARPDLVAPGMGGVVPKYDRMPNKEELFIRGTLKWDPSERFNATLKANYTDTDVQGDGSAYQMVYCPNGPIDPYDSCKADGQVSMADLDPNLFSVPNGGAAFSDTYQAFGSLEINYDLTDGILLTSVTGVYVNEHSFMFNGTFQPSLPAIAAAQSFRMRDITEELRITTDYADSPVNAMFGVFFQDGFVKYNPALFGNTALGFPVLMRDGYSAVDIRTVSVFGQLIWDLTDTLELAGGARWTSEKRKLSIFSNFDVVGPPSVGLPPVLSPTEIIPDVPRIKADNISPEATLTWRPTDTLTVFAAYKEGYKSGSFNTDQLIPFNRDFKGEDARGGEVGIKTLLMDRTISFNAAAYRYWYNNLQTSTIQGGGASTVLRVINAAKATVTGIDLDISYSPPEVEGLLVYAAANYNRGRYKDFNNAPCYGGQTIGLGCSIDLNDDGIGDAQDLSGTRLLAAPDWSANMGFDYDFAIPSSNFKLGLSSALSYQSKIVTDLTNAPGTVQDGFWKIGAGLRLSDTSGGWQLALIGNNLTNKYTTSRCAVGGFGNFAGVVANPRGGVSHATSDEVACILGRGREVWLKLSVSLF